MKKCLREGAPEKGGSELASAEGGLIEKGEQAIKNFRGGGCRVTIPRGEGKRFLSQKIPGGRILAIQERGVNFSREGFNPRPVIRCEK